MTRAGGVPEVGVAVGWLPGGEPRRAAAGARAEVAGVGDGVPEAVDRVVALRTPVVPGDGEEEDDERHRPQHC